MHQFELPGALSEEVNTLLDLKHWLLSGDVSIAFQTSRDLLGDDRRTVTALQKRIEHEGWGKRLLARRSPGGHWGGGAYNPKWISTHYTLLELKEMGISPGNQACRESVALLLESRVGEDGGINYARTVNFSDVCVNGMLLNMAAYFVPGSLRILPVLDYLLKCQLADGGWNCVYRTGAVHSSLHTTVSVLEGFQCYLQSGTRQASAVIRKAIDGGVEFLLLHRMFRSHRTGRIIRPDMVRLSFPCRWYYDILRGLECLRALGRPYDHRMEDAFTVLMSKRRPEGRWPLQAPHPGVVHFRMELVNQPSRWNTLRALRVLSHFGHLQDAFS